MKYWFPSSSFRTAPRTGYSDLTVDAAGVNSSMTSSMAPAYLIRKSETDRLVLDDRFDENVHAFLGQRDHRDDRDLEYLLQKLVIDLVSPRATSMKLSATITLKPSSMSW